MKRPKVTPNSTFERDRAASGASLNVNVSQRHH